MAGHGLECLADLPSVAGVDGCRSGWVVARLDPAAAGDREAQPHVTVVLAPDVATLRTVTEACAAIAIDIPIGLPDAAPRRCDQLARAALGPRRASVFPAPPRATLHATSYAEACRLARESTGRALSVQAYHLLPKIAAMDAALRADPRWAARVHEVHPELAFACLDGGRPMTHPKRHPQGAADRHALIEARFPGAFARGRAAVPRRAATDDDLLDALACLWSAGRLVTRGALRFPEDAPRDAVGLPMRIQA